MSSFIRQNNCHCNKRETEGSRKYPATNATVEVADEEGTTEKKGEAAGEATTNDKGEKAGKAAVQQEKIQNKSRI